jgi:hypothetical protein
MRPQKRPSIMPGCLHSWQAGWIGSRWVPALVMPDSVPLARKPWSAQVKLPPWKPRPCGPPLRAWVRSQEKSRPLCGLDCSESHGPVDNSRSSWWTVLTVSQGGWGHRSGSCSTVRRLPSRPLGSPPSLLGDPGVRDEAGGCLIVNGANAWSKTRGDVAAGAQRPARKWS